MKKRRLSPSFLWRRTLCCVVALLASSSASPGLAGIIQPNVTISSEARVIRGLEFGLRFQDAFFEPPPPLLDPIGVIANASIPGAAANAFVDTSGALGMRLFMTSTGNARAATVYSTEYLLQGLTEVNVDLQWFIGPLNIGMFGARDALVEVTASTTFTAFQSSLPPEILHFDAHLTLEVDSDGNLTPGSGLTVGGVPQPLPPIDATGDVLTLSDFFLQVPVGFVFATTFWCKPRNLS